MNLLINNYCNQKCPYCFAYSYMDTKNKKDMTFENYRKALAFLKASHREFVRFEGGEATLHPQFMDFVDYALAHGFAIMLFTNGLFDKKVRDFLKLRQRYVHYTWNLNPPPLYSSGMRQRLLDNLEGLSHKQSSFGVNIYSETQDLDYMFRFCKRFRPNSLRCVFAHRLRGGGMCQTIPLQAQRKVTPKIVSLIRKVGSKLGIPAFFDCGFIPCAWSDEALGTLIRCGTRFQGCEPCLGIDPDLNIAHCFHFHDKHLVFKLQDFSDEKAVVERVRESMGRYRKHFLFKKCPQCLSRVLRACDGGCLGDRKTSGVVLA